MDSGVIAACIGAIATVGAVLLNYYLSHYSGEKREEPASPARAQSGDEQVLVGRQALEKGEYLGAIQAFELALALGVNRYTQADIYLWLGEAYRDLGHYTQSVKSFQQALELDPEHVDAYLGLGITYRLSNEISKAEECYLNAMRLKPDSAELHTNLGVLYLTTGDPQRAAHSLQKAIQLNPQLATAHGNLALALAMLEHFDEAEARLKQATILGYSSTAIVKERIRQLRELH